VRPQHSDIAPRPADDRVSVRFNPPDVVEAVFSGRVTVRDVETAIVGVKDELVRKRVRYFLLDATDTTGYDTDVRTPGVQLLKTLREGGVLSGVCVAPSSTVRMIGAAVAFVAGLPIKFVHSRAEVAEILRAARAGGA